MNDCQNIFTEHRMSIAMSDPKKPITIIPFGDIHRDSHEHNAIKWREFLKEAKANDNPQTYYLCMGDELDFMSASERKAVAGLHESTLESFDQLMRARVWQLAEELKFMRGRMIGCLAGNHCHRMVDGRWSTELLCEEMGCAFLGYSSYIRISVKPYAKSTQGVAIDIFASHGKGSGRLLGSTYNTVERMRNVFDSADIYLMGHDHKRGALSDTRLGYDGHFCQQERRQWFGRTGSFLNGYTPGVPSYIVKAGYPPTDLGTIKFDVHVRRFRSGKNGNGEQNDRLVKDIRMTC